MMYIDGTAITNFGDIIVLDVDYGASTTAYKKDWLMQGKNYVFRNMSTNYATVKIKLLVKGTNRNTLFTSLSNLYAAARHSLITFNDRPFGVDGTLNSVSEETLNGTAKIITLDIEGAKVANATQTVTVANGTTFTPEGNLPCGFVMAIAPTTDISTLTMILNGETFKFATLYSSQIYTFDTTKGLFTSSNGTNCFTQFTGWELPYLIGGKVNLVTLDQTPSITFTYRGRWA